MVEVNDVVQLGPNCENPMFRYCFLTVTEVKTWGVQGYVQALGEDGEPSGQAYIRVKFSDFEPVGRAVWIVK